jgi:hypothetical protein
MAYIAETITSLEDDMTDKQKQQQGKQGKPGTHTSTGFQPLTNKQPKKSITLLDILLWRK